MKIILIPAVIAAVILITAIISIRNKKAVEYYLRHSYGDRKRVKDDVLDRMEAIALLYEIEKKNYSSSELVDGVTWDDLDMKSVFVRADHTDSFAGEQCLFSSMHILSDNAPNAVSYGDTAEFFDKNEEKRQSVRKLLHNVGKPINGYYSVNIADDAGTGQLPYRQVYPILLISLVSLGVLGLILRSPFLLMLCLGNYLLNLVIHIFLRQSFETRLESLFSMGLAINAGFSISSIVPELSGEVSGSLKKLKKAAAIMNMLNMQKSMMSSDDLLSTIISYATGPLMLDMILYSKGLDEISDKKEDYLKVHRFVGDIDCSIAIASFRKSLDAYCVPEIVEGKKLEFRGVFHPMLSDPVANDITQERNMILTGSNASGKSTFIKSVAINLILAQTICTCTAESACVPRCGVITSMAVRDDLASGESYYIREIKYLKRMTECVKQGKLLFLAIDEILKGTNTKERIAASKAVLRYFNSENCILMAATHDIELAEAFEGIYDNCYFCEKLDEDDIIFDYRIHKGICRSSNAIKLLSVIGFPDEIVSSALSEL